MKYNRNPLQDMTKTITLEMCECGRLFCDRISHSGKKLCSACFLGCDIETLKKLWGNPVPEK